MNKLDLQLIDTNDLITELFNRFDISIFGGVKIIKPMNKELLSRNGQQQIWRRWRGGWHECVGLGMDVNSSILEQIHKEERDVLNAQGPAEETK